MPNILSIFVIQAHWRVIFLLTESPLCGGSVRRDAAKSAHC